MLFTRTRQKTSTAVWDVLDSEDCSDHFTEFQLIRGCLVIIRDLEENFVASKDEGDPDPGLQQLAAIDIALANRIAGMSIIIHAFSVCLTCSIQQITSCYLRTLPITLILCSVF